MTSKCDLNDRPTELQEGHHGRNHPARSSDVVEGQCFGFDPNLGCSKPGTAVLLHHKHCLVLALEQKAPKSWIFAVF